LKQIAAIPSQLLRACLAAISGTDAIIVGGQALVYWADYYGVDVQMENSGVTKDLDLLGTDAHLRQLGKVVQATPMLQNPRFISALVGTIEIPLSKDLFTNIDVVHTLAGLDRDEVRRNAVKVQIAEFQCLFMHPLHVLESRLKNIEKIPQKRNPQAIQQAALAVKVVNRYIAQRANSDEESFALKAVEKVVSLGKVAAGKMAAKHGVNLIKAIPFEAIQNEQFQTIRKPQIILELEHLTIK